MREQFYEFKFSTRVWNTNIYTRRATSIHPRIKNRQQNVAEEISFFYSLW